jgi:hypothetical protein
MAKRGKTVKKTVTVTEITTKKSKPKADDSKDKTSKLLLDNFIALQEALTNIGYETKELNKKVTAMLDLFETAAKNFQEHPESRNLGSKMDELIEQNKIIAKSLLLMHKTTKETLGKKEDLVEGYKPSITEEPEEKKKTKEESQEEDVQVEKDDSSEESSSEEFKPEPLPEFNF